MEPESQSLTPSDAAAQEVKKPTVASLTARRDHILKARDALLRGFPEVESVIGKAGRASPGSLVVICPRGRFGLAVRKLHLRSTTVRTRRIVSACSTWLLVGLPGCP
jgi:hypothetical protein